MTYATIATFVAADQTSDGPTATMQIALTLAERMDAHLHFIAPGIDPTDTGFYAAGAYAVVLRENVDQAHAEAERLNEVIKRLTAGTQLRWDVSNAVVADSELGRYCSGETRFSDLMIVDMPYADGMAAHMPTVLEAALFGSKMPTLVLPENTVKDLEPARVMIAWNDSDEALTAVRAALPFLLGADEVDIVIIDPPHEIRGRSDPGGNLATFLSRHGILSEISILARNGQDVADVLIRRGRETGADLVVMGAYGHTRMREAIIGGATRHMLERATLPVFMAH